MDEYISKKQVYKKLHDAFAKGCFTSNYDYALISSEILGLPSADVQLVKYGRWVSNHNYRDSEGTICTVYRCSYCEKKQNEYTPPYCPECGADMRLRGDSK